MSVLSVSPARGVWGQLSRFVTVGVANTAVSLLTYRLLLETGLGYVGAGAVAFGAGSVNGYVLNRRWTFRVAGSARSRLVYVAVQAAGMGLTVALLWLLVDVGSVGRIAAQVLVIPPVTLTTFALNRFVTFVR